MEESGLKVTFYYHRQFSHLLIFILYTLHLSFETSFKSSLFTSPYQVKIDRYIGEKLQRDNFNHLLQKMLEEINRNICNYYIESLFLLFPNTHIAENFLIHIQ